VHYLPFNVLHDSFPDRADSYAIVSTGFMTSTVRPMERHRTWKKAGKGLAHLGLSLLGIMRVVELVRKGKRVDLFTIQRASSRVYKYKTALLQWREGRLVNLITTDDSRARQQKWTDEALASVRERICPSNPFYSEFVK
jgi:hypothetical protein